MTVEGDRKKNATRRYSPYIDELSADPDEALGQLLKADDIIRKDFNTRERTLNKKMLGYSQGVDNMCIT